MQAVPALPLGFALVAVPLAMVGLFRPLPVVVLTCLAAAAVAALWGPAPLAFRPRAQLPAIVALVVVAAVTLGNAKLSSQHVLVDRDPGVYTLTAKWLSSEHDLRIDGSREAFGGDPRTRHHGYGFYADAPGDRIHAQFLHLFPAALAVGDWVGGTFLLTKTNAVIAGLALLMVFAFATRLIGGWAALAAMIALALTLPFLHFARDTYSEMLTMALIFGGLTLLWSARSTVSARRGLVAGLTLGAACMARIDAFVHLAPLALYLGYELFTARDLPAGPRRARDRFVAAVAAGLALTATVGLLDGLLFSPSYFDEHRSELIRTAAGVAVALSAALVARAARGRLGPRAATIAARRGAIANAGAVVLVGLAAFAWFVRPHLDPAHTYAENWNRAYVASLQQLEGLRVDGTRTYAENSMTWLDWYLGPLGLALGVVGAALLLRRVLRGDDHLALAFLLVFLASAVLYLWKPSIYPNHVWASRRFMPVVIPGLMILCFWVLRAAWRRLGDSVPGRVAVVAVGGVAVGLPAWHTGGLADQRGTQVPLAYETEKLCDRIPDRAAVAVQGDEDLHNHYIQAVQTFCGTPVVSVPPGTSAGAYRQLERRVRERGRSLYLLTRSPAPFQPPPNAQLVIDTSYEDLERPITRRPSKVTETRFQVFLVPLSAQPVADPAS